MNHLIFVVLCGLAVALLWREGGTQRDGRGAWLWRGLLPFPVPLGSRVIRGAPLALGLAIADLMQGGAAGGAWWAALGMSLLVAAPAVGLGYAAHQDAGAVRVGDPWAPRDGETTEVLTRWLDWLFGPETRATPAGERLLRDCIGLAWIGLSVQSAIALPWLVWGSGSPALSWFIGIGPLRWLPYLAARIVRPHDPLPVGEYGLGFLLGLGLSLAAA